MSEEKQQFFYANAVEVAMSVFDINLKFMRTGTPKTDLQQSGKGGQTTQAEFREEMVVAMSPQQAKAFLPALTNVLEMYEKQFGVIPTPKEVASLPTIKNS